MKDNNLEAPKLLATLRSGKKDWRTFTGQVPPEVGARLDALITPELRQTDVVCIALTEYVERNQIAQKAA